MNHLPNDSNENSGLSTTRTEAAKKQAQKWFIILLTIGLILGAGMAVGVVKILNTLGLTEKPERPLFERPQQ